MRRLLSLIVCFPLFIKAQEESKGIQFAQGLSWEQVQAKAKTEDKYIFMDVYATWCGPCKAMDKYVYTKDSVGQVMNDKFISVKLQMDSTGQDNEQVKNWYGTFQKINELYKIQGFPSLLFFSPEGKIVFEDVGYKGVPEFLELAKKSLDPNALLYYSRLVEYKNGNKDYDFKTMGNLALFARNVIKDKELAERIAKEYKEKYLDKLNEEQIATREIFDFINYFSDLTNSRDSFFHLCYKNPEKVDQIIQGQGWAHDQVIQTIYREELDSNLLTAGKPGSENPNWNKIRSTIQKKYSSIDSKLIVLNYQVDYFSKIKDWMHWAKYKDQRIRDYPPDTSINGVLELNDGGAWTAFIQCNDKRVLTRSLDWIDLLLKLKKQQDAALIDTKANVLYKLGKVEDAVLTEEKALNCFLIWAKENENLIQPEFISEGANNYRKIISKMQNRDPTYLEQGAVWNANTLPKKISRKG